MKGLMKIANEAADVVEQKHGGKKKKFGKGIEPKIKKEAKAEKEPLEVEVKEKKVK
jgi:hypothetical protein